MKTIWNVTLLLAFGLEQLCGQDAFGYTATDQIAFSYVDIRQSGTAVLSGEDDAFATIQLPFGFRFYGNTFTSVCVSTNGALSFGGCPVQDFGNVDLTVQSTPGDLASAYPLWSDLSFSGPGGGAIYYRSLGDPGSRQFVIQWAGAVPLNAAAPFQFQVILSEATNRLLFQYLNVEAAGSAADKGASATVGIRAAGGNANQQRLQWSSNAAVLKNNLAVQFSPRPLAGPLDVTDSFIVTSTAFTLDRTTGRYTGTIRIINRPNSNVERPLTLLLSNLPQGVSAPTANGVLPGQGPYFAVGGTGPLSPGQPTTLDVQFVNPLNLRITFTSQVFSGIF